MDAEQPPYANAHNRLCLMLRKVLRHPGSKIVIRGRNGRASH